MAWVQVGPHKINTAQICYVDQKGDAIRIYFSGRWEGNPLELHFDEAKSFWRHLKAEDAMIARDKGSTAVLPRLRSAAMIEVHSDDEHASAAAQKPKVSGPAHAAHTRHGESHQKKH